MFYRFKRITHSIHASYHSRSTTPSLKYSTTVNLTHTALAHKNYTGRSNNRPFSSTTSSDTIYQLSSGLSSPSGHQSVGLAVTRVSGSSAHSIAQQLTGRTTPFKPRYATKCELRDLNHSNKLIDSPVLVLYFPGPNSYTGEDCIEFHTHGNQIILQQLFQALNRFKQSSSRVRLAEAGEFTRRAFENSRMDLTQIEGLADLLSAQTETQHAQAVQVVKGELRDLYSNWRTELIGLLAHIEAVIDFAEEEYDVEESSTLDSACHRVRALIESLELHINDKRKGEIIRSGYNIILLGQPNAGKSSLLNHLAQRDISIVSAIPGTTRDLIEVQLNLNGFQSNLIDTAGLRSQLTHDSIESEGIKRTLQREKNSDLKLVLIDVEHLSKIDFSTDNHELNELKAILNLFDSNSLLIFTKLDLLIPSLSSSTTTTKFSSEVKFDNDNDARLNAAVRTCSAQLHIQLNSLLKLCKYQPLSERVLWISVRQNLGVNNLLQQITSTMNDKLNLTGNSLSAVNTSTSSSDSSALFLTRERHRTHLTECLLYLTEFVDYAERYRVSERYTISGSSNLVLAAEQLRESTRSLGKIIGRVDVEELLDVIFKDFCIGK